MYLRRYIPEPAEEGGLYYLVIHNSREDVLMPITGTGGHDGILHVNRSTECIAGSHGYALSFTVP